LFLRGRIHRDQLGDAEPGGNAVLQQARQPGNLWRLALPKRIENWSLTSLQQRLMKTGGRLVEYARYYWLWSHLTKRWFGMLRRIGGLLLPTGYPGLWEAGKSIQTNSGGRSVSTKQMKVAASSWGTRIGIVWNLSLGLDPAKETPYALWSP
jgi:hypothetical protein